CRTVDRARAGGASVAMALHRAPSRPASPRAPPPPGGGPSAFAAAGLRSARRKSPPSGAASARTR
ncbi:hypothetical protein, partial [Nocardia asiatica]|uniref:hypothetical protein n=1 Tax=Nocardia asiatica TaxID=209252 RepID=UPI0024540C7D